MEQGGNIVRHLEATGDFETLEIMPEAGLIPGIDCSDGRGLMKACMAGSVECTRLLIQHGATVPEMV